MKEVLAIIGKLPLKGFSKTRLADDIGDDLAFKLYEAFIDDFFKKIPAKYKIYFFGTPNNQATKDYFEKKGNLHFLFQKELPFFKRLADTFKVVEAFEGKNCFIHLTGTDIPDFPFCELEKISKSHDVYLGPDFDGGYYYIGAKSSLHQIFAIDSRSGENSVLKKTLRLCEKNHLTTHLLRPWSDIDHLEDLRHSSLYAKYAKILS